uniref:Large ribosomal subunit protein mL53 n=1 Tax=Mola mola TaxID=94237 RepID=A0A3Q3X2D3_MOLML
MAAPSKSAVVLKAVKKIAVQFSPFESNVRSTEFLAMVGSEKVRATNMNCEVIATVKHNKSEPVVDITYAVDGEKLLMKGAKLTTSEMLSAFQTRCAAKDPQAKAAAKK